MFGLLLYDPRQGQHTQTIMADLTGTREPIRPHWQAQAPLGRLMSGMVKPPSIKPKPFHNDPRPLIRIFYHGSWGTSENRGLMTTPEKPPPRLKWFM